MSKQTIHNQTVNKIVKFHTLAITTLIIISVAGLGCSSKRLKTIAGVVALGVAAKIIYDMVVDYRSEQITKEDDVIKAYKKKHNSLPEEPTLVSYESSIKPGDVVKVDKAISIVSRLEVVPGSASKTIDIQEKLVIYDNEDNTKELKSLTKAVNKETQSGGAFENQFTFKLPKGMPQGIYPVKTVVIVNGKAFQPKESQMQLVLNYFAEEEAQLVAILP